jgi:hypothetical protein
MCRECSTRGREDEYIKVLVGKPKEKRPLRRPRCRWEKNIKMVLRKIG